MKDSLPNMDEVVRQKQLYFPLSKLDEFEKEFKTVPVDGEGRALEVEYNEMYVRGTVLKLIADVRLLIEEREQDKAAFEQLRSNFEALKATDAEIHQAYIKHFNENHTLRLEVAEQDKKIQKFKTDAEYLQNVIDAKDEMLAWAERLVGSGPVPGIHYDPTNWLKEYRSDEYITRINQS